ncbi:unnamed protein product, partial [Ectocarpus sp. 8 AP-2014]
WQRKPVNESYRRVQISPKAMATASTVPILLDHVLNSDHDALLHSAVFSGSHGTLFCVHCASDRYNSAPNFRRLALLDGIRCILAVHEP